MDMGCCMVEPYWAPFWSTHEWTLMEFNGHMVVHGGAWWNANEVFPRLSSSLTFPLKIACIPLSWN
jgi:hypothetical protein